MTTEQSLASEAVRERRERANELYQRAAPGAVLLWGAPDLPPVVIWPPVDDAHGPSELAS